MTALEASWVLNHATLASYKLVSYEIDCNILYAICNEETDLWNIFLIRKGKKLSMSQYYVLRLNLHWTIYNRVFND